ncbi:hypothetical protein FGO68_gene4943 [Halteria grandinella]|uniref:Casein kinase I n=1 Tax=Halteria grandinella TaxID=5974 RepID=A0A8J8T9Y9_HALGN|nr:hypothetical protein FGO68_gene4943 [Halteria grandinella]
MQHWFFNVQIGASIIILTLIFYNHMQTPQPPSYPAEIEVNKVKHTYLKELGQGTYGYAYAYQSVEDPKKLVAIKIPKPGSNSSNSSTKESYYLQRLQTNKSRHVLSYFGEGYFGGISYMKFEFVMYTVEEFLKAIQKKEVDFWHALIDLFLQMQYALRELHERGFLHQDVKPDNYMVDENGVVKILDFGLLNEYIPATTNRHKLLGKYGFQGSPLYASVNALNGYTLSRRDDLECLGYSILFLIEPKYSLGQNPKEIKETKVKFLATKNDQIPTKLRGLHKYLKKVAELNYSETPDYQGLEYCIRNINKPLIEEEADKAIDQLKVRVSQLMVPKMIGQKLTCDISILQPVEGLCSRAVKDQLKSFLPIWVKDFILEEAQQYSQDITERAILENMTNLARETIIDQSAENFCEEILQNMIGLIINEQVEGHAKYLSSLEVTTKQVLELIIVKLVDDQYIEAQKQIIVERHCLVQISKIVQNEVFTNCVNEVERQFELDCKIASLQKQNSTLSVQHAQVSNDLKEANNSIKELQLRELRQILQKEEQKFAKSLLREIMAEYLEKIKVEAKIEYAKELEQTEAEKNRQMMEKEGYKSEIKKHKDNYQSLEFTLKKFQETTQQVIQGKDQKLNEESEKNKQLMIQIACLNKTIKAQIEAEKIKDVQFQEKIKVKQNDYTNLAKEFKLFKEKAANQQKALNQEIALKSETINSLITKADQKCESDQFSKAMDEIADQLLLKICKQECYYIGELGIKDEIYFREEQQRKAQEAADLLKSKDYALANLQAEHKGLKQLYDQEKKSMIQCLQQKISEVSSLKAELREKVEADQKLQTEHKTKVEGMTLMIEKLETLGVEKDSHIGRVEEELKKTQTSYQGELDRIKYANSIADQVQKTLSKEIAEEMIAFAAQKKQERLQLQDQFKNLRSQILQLQTQNEALASDNQSLKNELQSKNFNERLTHCSNQGMLILLRNILGEVALESIEHHRKEQIEREFAVIEEQRNRETFQELQDKLSELGQSEERLRKQVNNCDKALKEQYQWLFKLFEITTEGNGQEQESQEIARRQIETQLKQLQENNQDQISQIESLKESQVKLQGTNDAQIKEAHEQIMRANHKIFALEENCQALKEQLSQKYYEIESLKRELKQSCDLKDQELQKLREKLESYEKDHISNNQQEFIEQICIRLKDTQETGRKKTVEEIIALLHQHKAPRKNQPSADLKEEDYDVDYDEHITNKVQSSQEANTLKKVNQQLINPFLNDQNQCQNMIEAQQFYKDKYSDTEKVPLKSGESSDYISPHQTKQNKKSERIIRWVTTYKKIIDWLLKARDLLPALGTDISNRFWTLLIQLPDYDLLYKYRVLNQKDIKLNISNLEDLITWIVHNDRAIKFDQTEIKARDSNCDLLEKLHNKICRLVDQIEKARLAIKNCIDYIFSEFYHEYNIQLHLHDFQQQLVAQKGLLYKFDFKKKAFLTSKVQKVYITFESDDYFSQHEMKPNRNQDGEIIGYYLDHRLLYKDPLKKGDQFKVGYKVFVKLNNGSKLCLQNQNDVFREVDLENGVLLQMDKFMAPTNY